MRIDPETGFSLDLERDEKPSEAEAKPSSEAQDPLSYLGMGVSGLVRAALAGTIQTARPLNPKTQPERFSPVHLNIVLLRSAGLKLKEIAEKMDLTPVRVSQILSHPYSEVLIGALMAQAADRMTDPVARIQAYANEMIDVKVQLVRNLETPKVLRNQIATEMLDRAGFGPRQKVSVEVQTPTQPEVPQEAYSRLAKALEQAQCVASVDYGQYTTVSRKGDEGAVKALPEPGTLSTEASLSDPPSSESKKEEAA